MSKQIDRDRRRFAGAAATVVPRLALSLLTVADLVRLAKAVKPKA